MSCLLMAAVIGCGWRPVPSAALDAARGQL